MGNTIRNNLLYPFIGFAAIALLWEIAALSVGESLILPTVGETIKESARLIFSAEFISAYFGTLLRALISFSVSLVLALALAVLSFLFKPLGRMFLPIISIIRALPTMSVILLLMLWTSSKVTPVVVAALVIFPTLYAAFYGEFNALDNRIIEMCSFYKVKKSRLFSTYVLPTVLPPLVGSSASAFSLTIKLTVAAEVLAQTGRSIGLLMQNAKVYFETPTLFALTLLTIATCIILEGVISLILKKVGKRA